MVVGLIQGRGHRRQTTKRKSKMKYYDAQKNHELSTYGDGPYGCRPYSPPQVVYESDYDRGYSGGKMAATAVVGAALAYFIMKAINSK